jgi:hypothetical protein
MNPTNIGNLLKSGLLALGVSSTILGYISAEMWAAIGGLILTIGVAIWQFVSLKTTKLIEAVADEPVVAQVVVHDPEVAKAVPSPKVVPVAKIVKVVPVNRNPKSR